MADPVLMENTKIGSYTIFNERVFNRNRRFFRKVYAEDLTPEMCASAGVSVPMGLRVEEAKPAPDVVEAKPALDVVEAKPTPPAEEVPFTPTDAPQRPDTTGWDEDQLRNFCQETDIPTHPSARTPGLQAAITRYFDELASNGAD